MDDFRVDVKTYIDTGVLPYTKDPVEIAWVKAQNMGLFEGKKASDKVTCGELVLTLDKLNLLK